VRRHKRSIDRSARSATAGLIISEGIWVSEDGQGWHGATGIHNSEQGAGWKAIADAIHGKSRRIFAQLWHQGAVSHPSFFHDGRLPLAPSAIDPMQTVHVASGTTMTVTPREMTRADIRQASPTTATPHRSQKTPVSTGASEVPVPPLLYPTLLKLRDVWFINAP